MVVTEDTCILI